MDRDLTPAPSALDVPGRAGVAADTGTSGLTQAEVEERRGYAV